MINLFKKDYGVSHVLGYLLTLTITSLVCVTLIFVTTGEIDGRYLSAAQIYAKDLSNKIADFVVNICLMKESYENANYSISLDIPTQLVNRYSYYIKIDNSKVYVNSSDGRISENSTLYDVPKRLNINVTGRVEGTNKLIVYSNRSDYVYRFDFGTNTSKNSKGYTKITDNCIYTNPDWRDTYCNYRNPINIYNPLSKSISDYQILIQINEYNFDYSLVADRNGSDLRFYNKSGSELPYWIERWDPDGENTSRVWVKVSSLNPGWNKIYMYYGNDSLNPHPKSDGNDTFIFFDDFTNGLNKWNQYKPSDNSDITNLDGNKLLITNNSAVVNKDLILTPDSEPVVIEAKVYAPYVSAREASMFVRSQDNSGNTPPYYTGHVFSSGNYTVGKNNLTILYYDAGWHNSTPKNGMPAMGSDWYRLRYILNGDDDCIVRYYYDNFVVDGLKAKCFGKTESGYYKNGYFGLCVINQEYPTRAIYDWIYVRKFAGNTTLQSGSRSDFEPVSYVAGTQSKNFYWTNANRVKSNSYNLSAGDEYDYVYNASGYSATFKIKNLPEDVYSLTFIVGNAQKKIDNVTINVTGGVGYITKKIINCDTYEKILFSSIKVNNDGVLEVTFDDKDSHYYWAIDEMTIEKGDRSINLEGIKR